MIAHRCIEHPPPFSAAELVEYRRITTWVRVSNDVSNAVEGDVIDTEAPNEVFDMVVL